MTALSPQDLDFIAAESEALEAAGVPWEWREGLWRVFALADHIGPEEGHPCPGGFGA